MLTALSDGDKRTIYHAGLLTYLSAAAGSNLNHAVGYLDFARSGSLETHGATRSVVNKQST
jgi:hypothetical protein